MVEQVAAVDDKRVVIYASGASGGWGVLLTHGASRRELSGAESGATRERMSLLAVVSAVEKLTRPTSVLVLTDSEYVRGGVAARTQGGVADERDADLWMRLGTAVKGHRVQWVVVDAALASRAAALAAAPATAAERGPATGSERRPTARPQRERAADEPRPDRAERSATRTPASAERAPGAASGSDDREASAQTEPTHQTPGAAQQAGPTQQAPGGAQRAAGGAGRPGLPADVVAALRPASSLGRPSGERASLPFRAGDPVPAPKAPPTETPKAPPTVPAPTPAETPEESPDEQHDTEEFLDELNFWLEEEPTPNESSIDEWLRDTPLLVTGISEDTITFDDPTGRTIGPIPLEPGLADQVDLGWRLRLTAARIGDAWHLRPTPQAG